MLYLEDAGEDGPDVRCELVPEGERQVDEHHDVAVTHVGGDVHLTGRLHNVRHQLIQLLHAQTSDHLRKT